MDKTIALIRDELTTSRKLLQLAKKEANALEVARLTGYIQALNRALYLISAS